MEKGRLMLKKKQERSLPCIREERGCSIIDADGVRQPRLEL